MWKYHGMVLLCIIRFLSFIVRDRTIMRTRRFIMLLAALLLAAGTFAMTTVKVRKAGTLASVLTLEQQDTCSSLAVAGKLNSEDIMVLRKMAGKRLAYLDLSEARIATSAKPYMVLDAAEECLVCAPYAARIQVLMQGMFLSSVERVLSYGPAYVLGYPIGKPFSVTRAARLSMVYNTSRPNQKVAESPCSVMRTSREEFVFHKGVTDEDWKRLKSTGIDKFAGHRLERVGGRCMLYCRTRKGVFSGDFFYKCSVLKTVVLPKDKSLDGSITEYESPVRYVHKQVAGNP